MRLQSDCKITIGHETITLRHSLGAAYRLERGYDGFANLLNQVQQGSFTAISDVLKEGSGQQSDLSRCLDSSSDNQSIATLFNEPLIEALAKFIVGFTGDIDDTSASKSEPAEQISFEEFHTRLYELATGWLDWSPEVAWAATPAEILHARKGKVEMLKAIYGGKTDEAPEIDLTEGPKDTSTRDALNALGDLSVTSMPSVR